MCKSGCRRCCHCHGCRSVARSPQKCHHCIAAWMLSITFIIHVVFTFQRNSFREFTTNSPRCENRFNFTERSPWSSIHNMLSLCSATFVFGPHGLLREGLFESPCRHRHCGGGPRPTPVQGRVSSTLISVLAVKSEWASVVAHELRPIHTGRDAQCDASKWDLLM